MSKKLFLMLVMLLCMSVPSMASWTGGDGLILKTVTASINELIEVERERNAALKEQNELLRLIKNKLSDIACLQAISNSSGCIPTFAESEEDSGIKTKQTWTTPMRGLPTYFYYNDIVKKNSTEYKSENGGK